MKYALVMQLILRLLRWFEIDRAVLYVLMLRDWQFVAGPVTALLIADFFTADVQGYFYTFAALLALQSFLELGFHVVIMNVASHEWAQLSIDNTGKIVGNADSLSRLVSLGRLICRWYAGLSLLFLIGVGTAGVLFFHGSPLPASRWLWPWLSLVVLTSLSLWALPFHSLLEGCNQVTQINRFRFLQALTGNLVVWICIPLGAELWTCVAIALVKVIWEAILLAGRYRQFFGVFLRPPSGPHIPWRETLWPLQWRLAVQGFFNYFAYWIFTPVMFRISPAVGGQMGMSWTVLTAVQAAALAWVQTRRASFGVLVANGEYVELDRQFRRLTWLSLAFVATAGGLFWGTIYLLHLVHHPLADRVLPLDSLGLFTLAIILYHVPNCQSFYVRAHKREMFLFAGVASSIAIGGLVLILTPWYGGARSGRWLFGSRRALRGAVSDVALAALSGRENASHTCRQRGTRVSKLRVLFVMGSLGCGGSERQLLEILKHLDRSRYEPLLYLIYRKGELLSEVPADVPVHAYWDRHTFPRPNWPGRILLSQARDLAETIRRENVNLVYDRTSQMTLTSWLATRHCACRECQWPWLIRSRNYTPVTPASSSSNAGCCSELIDPPRALWPCRKACAKDSSTS